MLGMLKMSGVRKISRSARPGPGPADQRLDAERAAADSEVDQPKQGQQGQLSLESLRST